MKYRTSGNLNKSFPAIMRNEGPPESIGPKPVARVDRTRADIPQQKTPDYFNRCRNHRPKRPEPRKQTFKLRHKRLFQTSLQTAIGILVTPLDQRSYPVVRQPALISVDSHQILQIGG